MSSYLFIHQKLKVLTRLFEIFLNNSSPSRRPPREQHGPRDLRQWRQHPTRAAAAVQGGKGNVSILKNTNYT